MYIVQKNSDENSKKQKEFNLIRARELMALLGKCGAHIDEDDYVELVKIFSTDQILHVDRNKLAELIDCDKENKELVRRESDISNKYSNIVKEHLIIDNQKRFLNKRIHIVRHQGIKIDGVTISMADLSDEILVNLGDDQITQVVQGIVSGEIEAAGQGMFWNVLISKEYPYVLKTQRSIEKDYARDYNRDSVARYSVVGNAIGKDFFPKQVLIQAGDSEQVNILQKKVDTSEMACIREKYIDMFIEGEYGYNVIEALKDPKNKSMLQRFIKGCELLYEEHGRVVDLTGENLFIGVSEEGMLNIKLVDYGTFSLSYYQDMIQRSLDVIYKLKSLIK